MDTLGPIKCVLIREVSSFQGANNTSIYEVGTWSSVLIREVSSFQGSPLRGVPLYMYLNCSPMLYRCKKFPPNTRESSGVSTAWIHPKVPKLDQCTIQ